MANIEGYLKGIDVSAWQLPPHTSADIDWARVKSAGVSFAIIKSSQGDYYRFTKFAQMKADAKAQGLHVGAYHFADASKSPAANVKKFVDCMGPLTDGDLFPAIDVEGPSVPAGMSGMELNQWMIEFSVEFAKLCPYPLMYYGPSTYAKTAEMAKAYPYFWMAMWTSKEPKGPFGVWPKWSVWQHAGDGGRCEGVDGPCDLDYIRPEELGALTVGGGGGGGVLLGSLAAAGLAVLALRG